MCTLSHREGELVSIGGLQVGRVTEGSRRRSFVGMAQDAWEDPLSKNQAQLRKEAQPLQASFGIRISLSLSLFSIFLCWSRLLHASGC